MSRRLRVSLLVGITLAWSVAIGAVYQRHHPIPWLSWMRAWRIDDPTMLVPTVRGTAIALGRLCAAAAIVGGAAALGAAIVRALWRPREDLLAATTPGERFWLSVACGLAADVAVIIVLAAMGLLYVSLLWLLVVGSLVFGLPGCVGLVRATVPTTMRPEPLPLVRRVLVVLMGLIILGTLPIALSPQVLHDSQVYHLALPAAYLDAHGFVRFPHMVFANTALNTEMLYTVALAFGGPPTAKLLHGACGLGMLYMTVALGRRVYNGAAGVLAAFVTLTVPLVLGQWPAAYVDLAAGFAFTAAVWGVWRGIADDGSSGALRVAAVALGLYAGMRYTSVLGVAGLAAGVAFLLIRDRSDLTAWSRIVLPLGIGAVAGIIPWLIKNAAHVGNPVFPLATGVFGLGPLSPLEHARTQLLVAEHGMGHGPLDLLLLPWRITVYGRAGYRTFDGTLTPVWLAALPAAALWRRRPRGVAFLGIVALGYLVAWACTTHISRYLLPAFPLFSLVAVAGLLRLLGGATDVPRWAGAAVLAAVAAAGVWWVPAVLPSVLGTVAAYGPVAWGRESPEDFIWTREQTAPVFAYMARQLPRDAVVIGLWENRGLRCPRRLEGDAVYEAPRWLDQFAAASDLTAFAEALRAQGFTHVLFNARHLADYPPRPVDAQDERAIDLGLARMRQFLDTQCVLRFSARDLYLYEITPTSAEAPARAGG